MSVPQLSALNLNYSFEDSGEQIKVLHDVSLEVDVGQLTSVVGPSGCGKSSLLYLLGLLDKPESGQILLGEHSLSDLSEDKRTEIRNHEIGFIFQFHFLIKELTVLENVRLPILKAGKSVRAANQYSEELLDKLGLADKRNRPAYKLSGGEQQRVAIARALSNSPKVLLADEPTGNLDTYNSGVVFEILQKFAEEAGISIVMVTHNEELAEKSDQVIKLIDGRIIS
jgi:lipoprotein-releasing system ATP-binding protein